MVDAMTGPDVYGGKGLICDPIHRYIPFTRPAPDRRVVLATITASGRAVVERATLGLNASVFEEHGLSPSDLAELTRLLGLMRATAGDRVD